MYFYALGSMGTYIHVDIEFVVYSIIQYWYKLLYSKTEVEIFMVCFDFFIQISVLHVIPSEISCFVNKSLKGTIQKND